MINKEEILNILRVNKIELQKKYPISELGLFGSVAREENNEQSDIDILVDFNDSIGIRFIDLAHELEDILQSKIDLVSKKGIKPKYLSIVQQSLINV